MMPKRRNRNPGSFSAGWRPILVWFVLLNVCWAQPVTLLLRNGDRISGEMVSLDANNVTITNGLMGRIIIPFSQVANVQRKSGSTEPLLPAAVAPPATNAPPPAPAAQATPTNQPPAQVAAPAPAPKPAAAAAAKPPVQPPPVKPKPPKHWNLTVDLGTDLEFSQTRRELFYGHVKWTYGKDRLRGIVDYLANYGKNGGIVSANDMTGSVRVEEDLNKFKRVFFFDAAGAGYNEIRKIDLSYDDSLGMGYKLVTLTNLIVSGDVGANYQKQHFSDGTSKDYEAVRLGEQMTWKISRKLVWDQKFEFYSRVSGIGDYRLRLESNLRYLLSNNLNLNFTTIDQFDTQPAPGITRNDLLLRATVGIKF